MSTKLIEEIPVELKALWFGITLVLFVVIWFLQMSLIGALVCVALWLGLTAGILKVTKTEVSKDDAIWWQFVILDALEEEPMLTGVFMQRLQDKLQQLNVISMSDDVVHHNAQQHLLPLVQGRHVEARGKTAADQTLKRTEKGLRYFQYLQQQK